MQYTIGVFRQGDFHTIQKSRIVQYMALEPKFNNTKLLTSEQLQESVYKPEVDWLMFFGPIFRTVLHVAVELSDSEVKASSLTAF